MYKLIIECEGFFTREREVTTLPLIGDSVIIEDLCTDAHPDHQDYSRFEISKWMTLEGEVTKRIFSFVGENELVYLKMKGSARDGGKFG